MIHSARADELICDTSLGRHEIVAEDERAFGNASGRCRGQVMEPSFEVRNLASLRETDSRYEIEGSYRLV